MHVSLPHSQRSGYAAIAVTSTASTALASEFGAAGVATYNHPSQSVLDQVRVLTAARPIRLVLDCITDANSVNTCFQAIARTGGRYACLEQCPQEWRTRQAVKVKEVMGFEVLGVDVDLGPDTTYSRKADPRLHEIGGLWAIRMQKLVQNGLVRPHPIAVVAAASGKWWDAVVEGLCRLQRGEVRGQKLVVLISAP